MSRKQILQSQVCVCAERRVPDKQYLLFNKNNAPRNTIPSAKLQVIKCCTVEKLHWTNTQLYAFDSNAVLLVWILSF